jgi:hypothetical protein
MTASLTFVVTVAVGYVAVLGMSIRYSLQNSQTGDRDDH